MTTPNLTPTLREALDAALADDDAFGTLTGPQRAELTALRDACSEPRWLPTEDGLAVYVDREGFRSVYYVRDGKVARYLRPDGTLLCAQDDPSEWPGTWEPLPAERPAECCGRCPETMDGGVDCTCEGNPRCATDEPAVGEQVTDRIGWLRVRPDDENRDLMREVPGGWADSDRDEYPVWPAEDYPDAEFTPIRTLADNEVAVKREDAEAAIEVAKHLCSGLVPDRSIRRTATSVLQGMAAALEAGR